MVEALRNDIVEFKQQTGVNRVGGDLGCVDRDLCAL
jgi:hypothetical protein